MNAITFDSTAPPIYRILPMNRYKHGLYFNFRAEFIMDIIVGSNIYYAIAPFENNYLTFTIDNTVTIP